MNSKYIAENMKRAMHGMTREEVLNKQADCHGGGGHSFLTTSTGMSEENPLKAEMGSSEEFKKSVSEANRRENYQRVKKAVESEENIRAMGYKSSSELKKSFLTTPSGMSEDNPLSRKGKKIMGSMSKQYGSKRGKQIFYASRNKGAIKGVD